MSHLTLMDGLIMIAYTVLVIELLWLAHRAWKRPSAELAAMMGPVMVVLAMNALRFAWYWFSVTFFDGGSDWIVRSEYLVLPWVTVVTLITGRALMRGYCDDGGNRVLWCKWNRR